MSRMSKKAVKKLIFDEKTPLDIKFEGKAVEFATAAGTTHKEASFVARHKWWICLAVVVVLLLTILLPIGIYWTELTIMRVLSIDKYVAHLDGASSIALVDKSKAAALAVADTNARGGSNVLATVDSGGRLKELTFSKDGKKPISLSETGTMVFKIHTDSKYTYMSSVDTRAINTLSKSSTVDGTGYEYSLYSFVNHNGKADTPFNVKYDGGGVFVEGEGKYSSTTMYPDARIYDRTQGVPQGYDMRMYVNTMMIRSYIMDNASGKVYSTESIGGFDIVADGVIRTRDEAKNKENFFTLGLHGDDLIVTNVVANEEVDVKNVVVANDGTKYILNNVLDNYYDEENNAFYTKEINAYMIDTAGNVYKTNSLEPESRKKLRPERVMTGGKEGALVDVANVDIRGLSPIILTAYERTAYVKGNAEVMIQGGSYYGAVAMTGGYQLRQTNTHSVLVDMTGENQLNHVGTRIGNSFEYIEHYDEQAKTVRVYEFDFARIDAANGVYNFPSQPIATLTDVTEVMAGWLEYGEVYKKAGYAKITPSGTKRYMTTSEDGKIEIKLTSDKVYRAGVLAIKPIK